MRSLRLEIVAVTSYQIFVPSPWFTANWQTTFFSCHLHQAVILPPDNRIVLFDGFAAAGNFGVLLCFPSIHVAKATVSLIPRCFEKKISDTDFQA